jgi:hypothetical protein
VIGIHDKGLFPIEEFRTFDLGVKMELFEDEKGEAAKTFIAFFKRVAFRMLCIFDHPCKIGPQDSWSAS